MITVKYLAKGTFSNGIPPLGPLILLFLLAPFLSFSQEPEKIYFEEEGFQCVENVSNKIFSAAKTGNFGSMKKYLKIIRKNCIEGKYLKTHAFRTYDKRIIYTDSLNKPIVLWISGLLNIKGEKEDQLQTVDQRLIDSLYTTYGEDLQIIAISRDKRSSIKKKGSQYDPSIPVVPHEKLVGDKKDILYVDGFKHFFLYPAMYVIDTDKRITGFDTGQYMVSDTVTLDRAVEKSVKLYKKTIQSGFSIDQDGVGQIKLGDDMGMHSSSEAIQLIPNSEGKIKAITVKSRVYSDINGYSIGSNIDSLAQEHTTSKRDMRLSKGSRILGSMGDFVQNGNIIYLDLDKNGSVDWIHLENITD